jgi:hypothetical protein
MMTSFKSIGQTSRTKIEIVTPARLVFAAFCLAIAFVCCGSWLSGMYEHLRLDAQEIDGAELNAQLKSVERKLAAGEDELQALVIPEGKLFANSFYGYALINLTQSRKSDAAFRERSRLKLEALLAKIKTMEDQQPYSVNANIKPKGGIILAGHTNLLRAGYVLIGGQNSQIIEEFHRGSASLSDAFLAGKVPFPECYPGYTWAEDAIFALESLRLHDVLFKSDYSKARSAWLSWMKNHLDSDSQMMVTQIDPQTGQIIDGPRGCALSWALAFLPQIDPEFSRLQFDRFRNHWFIPFLGMLGIQEWYKGKQLPTQFPAGPVVFGLGGAASGIGIATCRANGDYVSWHLLLRSLETLGFPLWTPAGEKYYFWGHCLLADVLALWGKTICRWDSDLKKVPAIEVSHYSKNDYDHIFLVTFLAACLVSTVVVYALFRRLVLLAKDETRVRPGWNRATIITFAIQLLAVSAYLFSPAVFLIQVIIFMLMVDMLEELAIRPRIVSAILNDKDAK